MSEHHAVPAVHDGAAGDGHATMSIEAAGDEDLEAITRIYNQSVVAGGASADLHEQTREERQAWLSSHEPREHYPVVVIRMGGEVVAFASLSRFHPRAGYDHDAELSYYVDRGKRGCGLGRALVTWGIEAARARGFTKIIGVIFADNAASVALMKRFSFIRYGVLPGGSRDSQGVLHDVSYWYRALEASV
ncbi:MAG: N-acetyltransferase family protein [Bifidobacterium psychraerophilum]|uniref:GNAT family N-acetyltransferase n=1 Tax=Bifidobacterium psychraerophilum TaxID=218140 RepID=UPI0039E9A0BF